MGVFDRIMGSASQMHPVAAERRRKPRVAVALAAELVQGPERIEAQVLDLSTHGAMVETSVPLRPGERFVLRVDGWPDTPTEVRWAAGGRSGLLFGR